MEAQQNKAEKTIADLDNEKRPNQEILAIYNGIEEKLLRLESKLGEVYRVN